MTTQQNQGTNRKHRHTGEGSFTRFIEDLLNRNLGETFENMFVANRAFVNVLESDVVYEVHVAAPGLVKNDFKLEIKDGLLHISAARPEPSMQEMEIRSREFDFTNFHRTFRLDDRVDAEKINAKYENGVLIVTLPKRVRDSWKKEIHVD
jgi:HSP20 family protein